ncbi:MAG: HAD family hydrolase [Bacteroidales bacterium]|nr:HAD family hydrolase [Bacteroidales bacterium]MCM1147585.1 HAD family hydrolase [Bacteroidales bacterium]MCM1206375.1 HAD family hydrolase [Bacillota bacterium]MCM1509109.1 HAD family hydrolase [Clostridium sp.]
MTKAILFDFDGTLANTAPGIVKTMECTFKEMGKPVPSEQDMRNTIGLPLSKALKQLNGLNDKETSMATEIYRSLFATVEVSLVGIFPKVKETLKYLHEAGIRLAICTSRNAESLDMIMQHHDIARFFETSITNSDNLAPKPAPDMVLALLKRMQLNAADVIVVGDTTFDIQMGNGAGCRTIAVTYGNHSIEQLASSSPSVMIDSFDKLLEEIK